jgi:outer membrane assembly lipoprotein YfiO
MKCRSIRLLLITVCLLAFPFSSPAPLIYRPGEGWTYEPVGGSGQWRQTRAKDQLEVAQAAFDKQAYGLTLKSARRVVSVWPLSDYAPQAQYLAGRSYEAMGKDEKAFKEYQKLIEKYPKMGNYEEILQRQYDIANRFLAGKPFQLWGAIPWFKSMDKTAEMYEKIVKNGPYSAVAPQAQLKIGAAREKLTTLGFKTPDYPSAAKAYELAADRYHDRPQVAADALFLAGLAYNKQAQTAEYDQTTAGQAIAIFTDFLTLYPNDARGAQAQSMIESLRVEQARGNFQTARFYESKGKWDGALIYYNEVVLQARGSSYGAQALERMDWINSSGLSTRR